MKQGKEATMSAEGLARARRKMQEAGVGEGAIAAFSHYYGVLETGASGFIPEDSLSPFTNPPQARLLHPSASAQDDAMAQTAVIRLNGGLGTSMGLAEAKSLLPVRSGLNFLDITVAQVQAARERHGAAVPVIFMNSFRTDQQTLDYLRRYPDLPVEGLPLSILQSQEPRLSVEDLEPVSVANDPEAEWCPPGHGDLYVSLWESGLLQALLERGFRYAQVANGDNLGAVPDGRLAAWFAQSGAPFAMEVCRRTANDRKGGHLAVSRDSGRLILREIAQTSEADLPAFQDEDRHPFFNTNTIWLDLQAVFDMLTAHGPVLGLPVIRNVKKVDPSDPGSQQVVQIETAMGSAIQVFEGATAIEVPRERFLPVKTTNELLLIRSDLYDLTDEGELRLMSPRTPSVFLSPDFYAHIDDFELRIPEAPSLRRAQSLAVEGDWQFRPGAAVSGNVKLGPEGGVFG